MGKVVLNFLFHLRKYLLVTVFLFGLIFSACTSVPKESMELSLTVGRDVAEMQRAHLELVNLYYDRLTSGINRFIDEVYAPYQTEKLTGQFRDDLFSTDGDGKPKLNLENVKTLLEELRSEIDNYRNSKLQPVLAQRDDLLMSINDSYNRIIYANSIVTGHLSSILKVHDAQNEILQKLNLGGAREKISANLSAVSDKIDNLTSDIKAKKQSVEEIIDRFNKLIKEISK
ncbi:MAG: hypothetical protein HYS25_00360 [Ignavibacteriales bacterium]|nr:hypothetical protein [Ignavibacteriales bacterium]